MNIVSTPYLRTSRHFPEEDKLLSVELSKMYIDIANAVNNRTIGLFPLNKTVQTGETYFLKGVNKQQVNRQVFSFTSTTSIAHNITFDLISAFSKAYGAFTDGTNWYGLIFGSNVAIAGQVSFYISPTQIVFLSGSGAPSVSQGTVVIEWISDT